MSRYERYVEALRDSDSEDEETISSIERYKTMVKAAHTNEVKDYIETKEDNKVLNAPAPEISPLEKNLPRATRRTLAQLRSGYSPFLKTYLNRIGKEEDDLCPDCKEEPHTTRHIFECSARPTTLTMLSLWDSPVEAAKFLRLDDSGVASP